MEQRKRVPNTLLNEKATIISFIIGLIKKIWYRI